MSLRLANHQGRGREPALLLPHCVQVAPAPYGLIFSRKIAAAAAVARWEAAGYAGKIWLQDDRHCHWRRHKLARKIVVSASRA